MSPSFHLESLVPLTICITLGLTKGWPRSHAEPVGILRPGPGLCQGFLQSSTFLPQGCKGERTGPGSFPLIPVQLETLSSAVSSAFPVHSPSCLVHPASTLSTRVLHSCFHCGHPEVPEDSVSPGLGTVSATYILCLFPSVF